jgi:hypothetical protein
MRAPSFASHEPAKPSGMKVDAKGGFQKWWVSKMVDQQFQPHDEVRKGKKRDTQPCRFSPPIPSIPCCFTCQLPPNPAQFAKKGLFHLH